MSAVQLAGRCDNQLVNTFYGAICCMSLPAGGAGLLSEGGVDTNHCLWFFGKNTALLWVQLHEVDTAAAGIATVSSFVLCGIACCIHWGMASRCLQAKVAPAGC
jgi:hypothetical protein